MDGREFSVYVCSFTLRVDRLDLWRTYGADGKGFCIASPFSTFNQRAETALDNMHTGSPARIVIQEGKSAKEVIAPGRRKVAPTLYRIKYGDKEAEKTLKALNPFLAAINGFLSGNQGIKDKVSAIVRILLSDILYLYKNKEYRTENEARILTVFEIGDPLLELDEKNPARIYAESEPFLFATDGFQIYLGPKVEEKTRAEYELKYRINKNKYRIEVIRSEVQYR